MTDEQIARKIGRPDEAGLRRVRKVTTPDNMQLSITRSIEDAERKRHEAVGLWPDAPEVGGD